MVAPTPILPKLAPQPVKPVPLFFVPVNLNLNLTNGLCNNGRVQLSLIAQPPSPPPVPPISLLKQSRRRIPILIDQKSIKKNLQLNKQTLQTKLAARPEPTQLIERGILRSEEEKLRRFQHRENIRSHIEKRPTRETLVTQGILLSDACVDPLIRVRGQLLKRNKLVDNLNNKLRKRPGPLELVNRKILQVDAELEQAVHEGRLPFTSTLSSPSSEFGEATEMISTIIPLPLIRHDEQQYSSSSSSNNSGSLSSTLGPKAKVRKKSQQLHRTPYDNTSIISNKTIKLKAIANSKRATNESSASSETTSSNLSADFSNSNGISPMETDDIHSDNMQSETNYEINLKQQQLFLQWQEDHFKNPHDTNAITPAMSSTTSNCSTPLQSNDTPSIHSTRSSFSVSSTHSGNHGNTRLSSLYSPSVSPTHGTETTLQIPIIESEKPKSKLADFKVQDLKAECKKRQLPVSGAKPQLLERLKPYEDIILATSTSINGSTPSVSTSATSVIPSECSEVSSTSSNTCQNSCGHQQQQTIYQTQPLLPAQDVITDYLQQCQPQQSQQQQQQKPLVLQLPPNSKAPQLVQVLVDSNGTVVGVAAMPQQTITPSKSSSIPCCCIQCKKQPGSHISTIAETVIPSKSHESKLNEPTFSFSQMGSGGQFTLANSSPIVSECRQMAPNCAGCIAAASQSALKIVSSEIVSTNSTRSSIAATPSNSSHTICTAPPLIRSHTSSAMSSTKKPHSSLQKSESNSSTVEQTVAAVAHRRHSIPASVFSHNEELSDKTLSPDQTCQIPSPTGQILPAPDEESDDTNLDEIDPNILMTAKTFSQHEENLRIQQRLIEDLQAELAKSQEQLRREQKLIIAAKRMQLRTDQQTGKQCTQAEILLNNLDIKQINKHHIQHFIQHKSQQQSVQAQSNDYQELLQVEQKLQEELHMEQAVQDIVKFIKQDGRTALLIVQLLRRYQLERNHQLQQVTAAAAQQQKQSSSAKLSPSTTATTAAASGQNELTPGSNQQQECSGRTSVMSSKSNANESSGSICCQQHSHQPQSVESCCTNRTRLSQQKSAQIVVIDDSPATSPAPINNAASATIVGEALPKQKETSQRSKSQNPRTNKRKNNGSRSIWAKTNLIEKSASFTNTNTSGTPSKVVDMEEIFRTVINDTSYSVDTDTFLSTATLDTCQIQQKSQPLNQQIITNMDASSELVPQLNGFHLVANSDDSSNSAIADEQMDHSSSYQQYTHEYIIQQQQPMQTEICSTTAIFVQPENISSCHVDCYSKPRNKNSPERVEIIGNGHEYVQTSNIQQYEYAKNEDFEDLMDVLRDDQECIDHGPEDENCGRQILGYTSAELATFLAADENIVNNGNIYEPFVQTQGQPHYAAQNYHQHCVQQQQQNNITYENQGNVEYEITGGNLDPHSTLHIEPHQEQAIDDILNNSEMMEPSVEWFDNYFQSPITERQMTACGNRAPNGPNIHRPMDTFV